MSKDAWALMERHQPYKRGKGYAPKTLGYLHWLSIEDKHRALTYQGTMGPMFGQHFRVEWEGGPSEPLRVEHPFRAGAGKPVKGEAEVLRLYFPPGLDLKVWVQRDPDFTVGLGRVPRRFRPARLGLASQFVRAIIDDFAELVP